jgi:mono/diheme cytochrome c family protein
MNYVKRIKIGFGCVTILAVGLYSLVYLFSETRINRRYSIRIAPVTVPTDTVSLFEGKRLFISRGCSDCHGNDMGGKIFVDDPIVGTLSGSNLTRGKGGIGNTYEALDFVRAIRYGIASDGKPLIYMPSQEYNAMNDDQLGAIIAYIRSAPAVDNVPPLNLGPLMRIGFLAGKIPLLPAEIIDHQAKRPPVIAMGATVEYGKYLVNTCTGCHGKDLAGGAVPGAPSSFPKASNITNDPEIGIGRWTEADFFKAMREGKRPDGSQIDPFMPWKNFVQMTDVEIKAIWYYLQTIQP